MISYENQQQRAKAEDKCQYIFNPRFPLAGQLLATT